MKRFLNFHDNEIKKLRTTERFDLLLTEDQEIDILISSSQEIG